MEVLYLLIPIAMLLVALIAWVIVWAISSGQYEDLERAAEDILIDDEQPEPRPPSIVTNDGNSRNQ